MTASTAMLVLRSVVANGRRPQVWQSELMLQVTWCSRKIRTPPAHSSAVSPPARPPEQPADPERDGQRDEAPQREELVHHDQVAVLEHVRGVALPRRGAVAEQPADMGMPQAPQLTGEAGAGMTVG